MSYAQTMRWHKKHPRGGKPQYMGFDTGYRSPKKEETVFMKLVIPRGTWIYIGTLTLKEAFAAHPDAIRFARFGLYNEFRANGPAATKETP
jgi:hypothetical protein